MKNVILAVLLLPLISACGVSLGDARDLLAALGWPVPPDDAWPSEVVLATAEGQALIGQLRTSEGLLELDYWQALTNPAAAASRLDWQDFYPHLTGLVRVDVATLTQETLPLPTHAPDGVMSEQVATSHWLVWIEPHPAPPDSLLEQVYVRDLTTGSERLLLESQRSPWLAGISVDLAVVIVPSATEDVPSEMHVFDLAAATTWIFEFSGQALVIADGELIYLDRVVAEDGSTVNRLRAMDLVSGTARTVLENPPAEFYEYRRFVPIPGHIVWSRLQNDDYTVFSLDLATGAIARVVSLPQAEGRTAIQAANASGVLLARGSHPQGPPITPWDDKPRHVTYVWASFDGTTQTLLEYEDSFDNPAFYESAAAIVGNSVLLRDARTGDWIAYDVTTRNQRTFSVFD